MRHLDEGKGLNKIASLLFSILAWILLVAVDSNAGDKIQIAQEIVQLRKIPLSRPLSFEEAGQQDSVNFKTLLVLMELGRSSGWNTGHPQWNPTFSSVRQDIETLHKRYWAEVNEQAIASGYRSERSLAAQYASGLSESELAEILDFYRSPIGTKYLSYLESLRATVAEGQFETMKIMVDPSLGASRSSLSDRVQVLQKRGLRDLRSSEPAMRFYTEQAIKADLVSGNLDSLLRLGLGAQLLDKKFDELDQSLTASERQQISRFQQSVVAKKERETIQEWTNTVQANIKVNAIFNNRQKAAAGLLPQWKRSLQEQSLLQRRATSELELAGFKPGISVESLSQDDYQCSQSRSSGDVTECKKITPGMVLGVSAAAVKLEFKKDLLYRVSVDFASTDTTVVVTELEKTFGVPVEKKQGRDGHIQAAWLQSLERVMVFRDDGKRRVTIELVDYKIGELKSKLDR